MTRRDMRGDKRPRVARYHAFKDEVRLRRVSLEYHGQHVIFHMPMPKSWSKSKKMLMDGAPHQIRPDKDNLEKALLDAVFEEDSLVWDSRVTKVWAYEGAIEIKKI